jgi:hypothetical protein
MFNILYGEAKVKTRKKSISGLLRRKNKGKKEASADIAPPSLESELPQIPEISPNPESTTCPNNKCGRVFDKPLELIDLARPSDQSSHVCPYCLTKLEPAQPKQEAVAEAFSEETVETVETVEKVEDATEQEEGKCPHFVGYLKKRPKNAPIPDFCLTCPQMMECMLR